MRPSSAPFLLRFSKATCRALIRDEMLTPFRARVKFGYDTYRYHYSGNFSNISPLPWIGATHSGMSIQTLTRPLVYIAKQSPSGTPTSFRYALRIPWELDAVRVESQLRHGRFVHTRRSLTRAALTVGFSFSFVAVVRVEPEEEPERRQGHHLAQVPRGS